MNKINIICPTWNRLEMVKLSLESIDKYINLDYVDKFLIVDDASTDGTWEFVQAWACKRDWAEVVMLPKGSLGNGYSFVKGVSYLKRIGNKSDWSMIFCSDWYLCGDFFKEIHDLIFRPGSEYNALSCYPIEFLVKKEYVKDEEDLTIYYDKDKRVESRHGVVTGGMTIFKNDLALKMEDYVDKNNLCSISSLFNKVALPYGYVNANWIIPSFPFIVLDYLFGSKVTEAFHKQEDIDKNRLLELIDEYYKKRWTRIRVNPDTGLAESVLPNVRKAEKDIKQWIGN